SPAVGADGTIYVGGLYDPNLYSLDANDGSVKWACNFEYLLEPRLPESGTTFGWPFASPVVAEDGTIYQTLLYDPNLYAIKPNEPNVGTIIWSTNLADSDSGWFDSGYISSHGDVDAWSEPVLGPDGTIYVSLNDPYLRAVEPNGSIKWVTRLGMMDGFTLTVGSDGLVYAAGNDGWLCVVDANGYELARFQGDNWLSFPVISADNTIIVSDANRVWAIDGCAHGEFVLHRPEDVDASRAVDSVDFALLALDWLACNDIYPPCEALVWDGTYFTGDIDRNLYVNFADVAAIANRWLSADYTAGTCWDQRECAGQPFGDATCDGQVNLDDLAALNAAWGMSSPYANPHCRADFNHDGCVDDTDLAILETNFSTSGYSPSTGNENCPSI
ncbi:MAG: dockerin type I domain-containing protein, partial [Planctomycetota bacterium]